MLQKKSNQRNFFRIFVISQSHHDVFNHWHLFEKKIINLEFLSFLRVIMTCSIIGIYLEKKSIATSMLQTKSNQRNFFKIFVIFSEPS